jgi:hypothetical protein
MLKGSSFSSYFMMKVLLLLSGAPGASGANNGAKPCAKNWCNGLYGGKSVNKRPYSGKSVNDFCPEKTDFVPTVLGTLWRFCRGLTMYLPDCLHKQAQQVAAFVAQTFYKVANLAWPPIFFLLSSILYKGCVEILHNFWIDEQLKNTLMTTVYTNIPLSVHIN